MHGGAMRARRVRRVVLGGLLVAMVAALLIALLASGQSTIAGSSRHSSTWRDGQGTRTRAGAPTGRSRLAAEEAAESPKVRSLIAMGMPIYCAGRAGNELALTFDDGPGTYTKLAIAKLRKHRVKATFFIVGRNISLLPKAIRQERAVGSVGDHTFTHPRAQNAVEQASHGPVFLFRPPYGAHDATVDAIVRKHNLLQILWTVDSADSLGASYSQIERNVIEGLHPGAIILMHENHGQTIRAMLGIFAALERKHLRTVSVARLLTDDPPSAAQVRAGGSGCGGAPSAGRGGG